MGSRHNQDIRIAKLEAELDAERKRSAELDKRSAEFDQAFKRQLDANRALIAENATMKAELHHLNEKNSELSQERSKLLKQLVNENRSARNREANANLGAGSAVKRELVVSEQDSSNSVGLYIYRQNFYFLGETIFQMTFEAERN